MMQHILLRVSAVVLCCGVLQDLKESTIRGWMQSHQLHLPQTERNTGGKPPIVPEEVQMVIRDAWAAQISIGVEVDARLCRAIAIPILAVHGYQYLVDEGKFKTSDSWIYRQLHDKLGYSHRAATAAAQKPPEEWESKVLDMNLRVSSITHEYGTPESLVINADQTGVRFLPARGYNWAKVGAKAVPVIGADDKRQFTVMMAAADDGAMLAPQLVFQGTTARSLPPASVASDEAFSAWHFTHSKNHWSNIDTMKDRPALRPVAYALWLGRSPSQCATPR
jgi:hypothetical protein